jgi:hypothetical protein
VCFVPAKDEVHESDRPSLRIRTQNALNPEKVVL